MQKKKKIILHIGMHKTGTTALQGFFAKHAGTFLNNKILYPVSGRRSNQHFFLASLGMEGQDKFIQSWRELYKETAIQDWHTMVLSSERFFLHPDPTKIKAACESFSADIHVVLFLRNHIDAVRSLYRTAIKSMPRVCCTASVFTDFLIHKNAGIKLNKENSLMSYHQVIDSWESVFSVDNVHVISYDKIKDYSNTIEAFLELMQRLGIQLPDFSKSELSFRIHQTQPDLILDLLLRTNQFCYREIPYWKLVRHLFEIGADSSFTTIDMQFSACDAESILSAYGSWDGEETHFKKILDSNRRLVTEDERKEKQFAILKSIDSDWQDILRKLTMLSKEQILNLPVLNNPFDHYKLLYEREYCSLKFKLDREAFIMNKDKHGSILKAKAALGQSGISLVDTKKGIRRRLRRLLFKN
jgi:hypothetical protein